MTTLENEYAAVILYKALVDLFLLNIEYLQYILYAKSIAHASVKYEISSSISSATCRSYGMGISSRHCQFFLQSIIE
jgi:hypothetical protein